MIGNNEEKKKKSELKKNNGQYILCVKGWIGNYVQYTLFYILFARCGCTSVDVLFLLVRVCWPTRYFALVPL